ncbi:glycosyl transferase family 9 [Nitrosococcus halophilus Nc 4]|uniref:Glycosyl transferase family 9 n=1 Tax=Nitrosococcus halophilus (strain Nc4) TaxID=472759 RepID=D5C0U6_NITHN|nr:glycosyltransferase family 9 protein [Nitrosococcus halophilus]ADE16419.1 glycosyl transferase family 9 [Nitrosococcus halophilus Nc 4]
MQRVLIIKLGALGDIIIATPHIKQIVRSYPEAEIWLLTAPEFASLFEEHPNLGVKPFPRKGLQSLFAPLQWIRSQSFEVVFDLQGSDRSKMMTALSGATRRYGLGPGFPYTHCPPNKGIVNGEVHSFSRLNRLLETAGLAAVQAGAYLEASEEQRLKVRDWLGKQGLLDREIVLIHAGSSTRWESKRWVTAHFVTLATVLEQQGITVVWVGGSEDVQLNQVLSQTAGIDASGAFSLLELTELARHARFAVTTDSAPMHAIAAADIPVYALFGPTDWRRSHALGQKQRVLTHSVACSPCYLPECPPQNAHRCLAQLQPGEVLARLQQDGMLG